MTMKEIQILFVVETDSITKSDDVYYTFLMRTFFGAYLTRRNNKGLFIQYRFVYMGGSGKYRSQSVLGDIKSLTAEFASRPTYVVYCLDVDRLGHKDQSLLDTVIDWCERQGYHVSLVCPEIETMFHLKGSADRKTTATYFARHWPKAEDISKDRFFSSLVEAKTTRNKTNFGTVIEQIVKRYP